MSVAYNGPGCDPTIGICKPMLGEEIEDINTPRGQQWY